MAALVRGMPSELTRRELIRQSTAGVAGLALGVLAHENTVLASKNDSASTKKQPHFRPRAKSVIYRSMSGGPSQVDTFDYKPALQKSDGKSADAVGGGTPSRLIACDWLDISSPTGFRGSEFAGGVGALLGRFTGACDATP